MTTNEAIERAEYQLAVMEAFTQGQPIECNYGNSFYSLIESDHNWLWPNYNYRVQPQPTFSVGDWVVASDGLPYRVIYITDSDYCGLSGADSEYSIDAALPTALTPWQPKSGDWVWMWGDSHVSGKFTHPRLFQFSHMDEDGMYVATLDFTMPYCEPFIGSLPSSLKVEDDVTGLF